jgi:hypothetical protein
MINLTPTATTITGDAMEGQVVEVEPAKKINSTSFPDPCCAGSNTLGQMWVSK